LLFSKIITKKKKFLKKKLPDLPKLAIKKTPPIFQLVVFSQIMKEQQPTKDCLFVSKIIADFKI